MESNGTAAAPTGPAFFKQLHDAGVTISITVGGAGASVPGGSTDPQVTLTSFKSALDTYGVYEYVDGIDFDWENSGAAAAINNLAPAFKKAGFVVTSAPMASQLHGGCGYKWQEDDNELAVMNYDNMDGILVQWYQGACENLGHCPHAQCGKSPGAGCFDVNFSVQILTLLENVGACTKSGKQNGDSFANCSGVLDTCKTFPLEKIAIGTRRKRKGETRERHPVNNVIGKGLSKRSLTLLATLLFPLLQEWGFTIRWVSHKASSPPRTFLT
jgi:hypothetical protein